MYLFHAVARILCSRSVGPYSGALCWTRFPEFRMSVFRCMTLETSIVCNFRAPWVSVFRRNRPVVQPLFLSFLLGKVPSLSQLSAPSPLTVVGEMEYNTRQKMQVVRRDLFKRLTTWLFSGLVVGVFVCGCHLIPLDNDAADLADVDVATRYWDGPRIGPGMALVVQVGSSTAESKEMQVLVDQNGSVTLPYLLQSAVPCDGLTLEALRQRLIKAYSEYIRQPQISVTFGQYDIRTGVSPWGTVTVMGEVLNPGPVNMPATMDLTVTKVLQVAGGLKPFADKTNVVVSRRDKDGRLTRTKVNLREIGEGGRPDKDITLRAGDVVNVPETWY